MVRRLNHLVRPTALKTCYLVRSWHLITWLFLYWIRISYKMNGSFVPRFSFSCFNQKAWSFGLTVRWAGGVKTEITPSDNRWKSQVGPTPEVWLNAQLHWISFLPLIQHGNDGRKSEPTTAEKDKWAHSINSTKWNNTWFGRRKKKKKTKSTTMRAKPPKVALLGKNSFRA